MKFHNAVEFAESTAANLTDEQRLLVLGRMYERQKKAATGFADRDVSGAQNKHRQKTAEKIASLAGVGQATVRRAAEFAKAVDATKAHGCPLWRAAKEIYEAKHPETKKGGDRGNQYTGGKPRQSEIVSFSHDTATKLGVTTRTVQRPFWMRKV